MYHINSLEFLYNILIDFPIAVILSRVSLLQEIIDIVGSNYENNNQIDQLNSLTAMHWLTQVVHKAIDTFCMLFEGNLCSLTPNETETETEMNENNNNQYDMDMDITAKPSLIFEMVSYHTFNR